jgi:1,4-dihydroxy-2-naphthoate polyprenyltransferase
LVTKGDSISFPVYPAFTPERFFMKDQEVSQATDTSLADNTTSTSPHVVAADLVQEEEGLAAASTTTSTAPHVAAADLAQEEEAPATASTITSTAPHVIAADLIQAEEVPTIPLESLQTLSTLQPEISVRAISATSTVALPTSLVVQPVEYQRGLGEWTRIWWDGLRPFYLSFPILPVLLGSALAWLGSISTQQPRGDFHFQRFVVALLAVSFLQLGANLLNDYYDYLGGIDTSNALGPGNLIQQGLIKPARVLSIGITFLVLGSLFGVLVAIYGGLPAFGFGALGLLAAYFYSASRHSLSALTLGQVVGFWVFGPLLTLGAYVIQRGKIDILPLICSISLGLLLASALYVNDMRDRESDAQARKHTLATLLHVNVNRVVCTLLLLGAYVPIFFLGLPAHGPHLVLIVLWSLPSLVVILLSLYRTTTPASLHITMHQVLKLAILFTVLLIVALTIVTYWQLAPTFALPKWLFVF